MQPVTLSLGSLILSLIASALVLLVAGGAPAIAAEDLRAGRPKVELDSIYDAFGKIKAQYIEPVDDSKLVIGCSQQVQRSLTALLKGPLPHAIEPDPAKAPLDQIREMLTQVKRTYPDTLSDRELTDACLNGMMQQLDQQSAYLDPAAFKDLLPQSARIAGIGVELDAPSAFVRVVRPVAGAPAERAGLRGGDLIVKIDGDSMEGVALRHAINRLRGEPGSTVRLTLVRTGESQPLELEVTREIVRIETVKWTLISDSHLLVRITHFQARTPEDLARALIEALGKHVDLNGFIVDLRDNPGGLLHSCIGVSAAFLPESALVVRTNGRTQTDTMQLYARRRDYLRGAAADPLRGLPVTSKSVPLAIIVNRGSAACSEIVAAAVQDYRRGVVIGEQTLGFGTVQTVFPLKGDVALKLTTSKFFRPAGEPIDKVGVTPDIHIAANDPTQTPGTLDPAIQKAIDVLSAR
jgi:carboxyl-terminal processing protease